MRCIEILVVFAVRTFDFPAVPRRVRLNKLVLDFVCFYALSRFSKNIPQLFDGDGEFALQYS